MEGSRREVGARTLNTQHKMKTKTGWLAKKDGSSYTVFFATKAEAKEFCQVQNRRHGSTWYVVRG